MRDIVSGYRSHHLYAERWVQRRKAQRGRPLTRRHEFDEKGQVSRGKVVEHGPEAGDCGVQGVQAAAVAAVGAQISQVDLGVLLGMERRSVSTISD